MSSRRGWKGWWSRSLSDTGDAFHTSTRIASWSSKHLSSSKVPNDEETFEMVRSLRDNCPELAEGTVEGLWCSQAKTPQTVVEGAKLREFSKALVSLLPPAKAGNIKSDPRSARVILAPEGETLARIPFGEQQLQIRYDFINETLGVAKGGLDKAMAALQEERRWG